MSLWNCAEHGIHGPCPYNVCPTCGKPMTWATITQPYTAPDERRTMEAAIDAANLHMTQLRAEIARLQEQRMEYSRLDNTKVVPYIELKPSAQAGCVNIILPTGRVFSAHGDDRDAGSDGPWEQGQVVGNQVTYLADGVFFTWLIVPTDKLPR